jgi:hypothetical protein
MSLPFVMMATIAKTEIVIANVRLAKSELAITVMMPRPINGTQFPKKQTK